MSWQNPGPAERLRILRGTRTVAVLGASANPSRASNFVLSYLLACTDFTVYPVNPAQDEVLGRRCYPSLAALPEVPDLVDVFRRRSDLPAVLDDVLALGSVGGSSTGGAPGVRTLWTQFGLLDEAVAERAAAAGLAVVMDRCLKVEHARFHGGLHLAGFDTGVISARRRSADGVGPG